MTINVFIFIKTLTYKMLSSEEKNFRDYIREIEEKNLRLKVEELYSRLEEDPSYKNLKKLMNLLEENRDLLGVAQYYGKMRATLLELYVYLFFKKLVDGKYIVAWRPRVKLNRELYYKPDVAVFGEKGLQVVVECKVELDASRLKTALGDKMLLNASLKNVKYIIVYYKRELSDSLFNLAIKCVDGIFSVDELSRLRVLLTSLRR